MNAFQYRSAQNRRRVSIGAAAIALIEGDDDLGAAASDLIADVLHAVHAGPEGSAIDPQEVADRAVRAYEGDLREEFELADMEGQDVTADDEVTALSNLLSHDADLLLLEQRGEDTYGLITERDYRALRALLVRLTPTR